MTVVAMVHEPDDAPDPPHADELAMARRCVRDPEAFARLYHAHVERVYARLTRLVGPIAERDDLVQQVFLQVHQALARFRGDAALATFIHRIAVNVAVDHLRQRARRPVVLDDDGVAAMVADQADPATRAAAREELATVFALLDDLALDQRIAFVLIAIEGLSARAAAELVGASPDAVKQRAISARRALTASLAASARLRRIP